MTLETRTAPEHTKAKGAHRRTGERSKRVFKLMLQPSRTYKVCHTQDRKKTPLHQPEEEGSKLVAR
eukprot:11896004-Prorocentrum_lima.AAC.1